MSQEGWQNQDHSHKKLTSLCCSDVNLFPEYILQSLVSFTITESTHDFKRGAQYRGSFRGAQYRGSFRGAQYRSSFLEGPNTGVHLEGPNTGVHFMNKDTRICIILVMLPLDF